MSKRAAYAKSKKGIFDKFLNMIGIEDEYIEEEEDQANPEPDEEVHGDSWRRQSTEKPGKVFSLYTQGKQKVVVVEPKSLDDVPIIINHLRNKHPIIVNLEDLDKLLARRIVDFVYGAIYALDGYIHRVSEAIFLFTPSNTDIAIEQIREQMSMSKSNFTPDFDFKK